jgi:hypothetical protein
VQRAVVARIADVVAVGVHLVSVGLGGEVVARIAEAIGVPALRRGDLAELSGYGVGLDANTPLWYYVLKEAAVFASGQHLGPVGGRIVGEVIIGLMLTDRNSWLASDPHWRPTLPSRRGSGEFDMVDLLTLAGVDPRSRGQ